MGKRCIAQAVEEGSGKRVFPTTCPGVVEINVYGGVIGGWLAQLDVELHMARIIVCWKGIGGNPQVKNAVCICWPIGGSDWHYIEGLGIA